MKKGKNVIIENIPKNKNIRNMIINILKSNSIQKYKNKNTKITIIITIIYLIIFICNLYYLHNLENCICFQLLNIDKKINLNYLLAINYILIFFSIINIINIITISKTQKGGSSLRIFVTTLTTMIFLLFISIYAYYMYNVYEIYKKESISKYCDCLESKLKYSLYIHGAITAISVVMLIITLILCIILLN